MQQDTFFKYGKHKFVWYQPLKIHDHLYLDDAVEAVELWMKGKIRHSPCNLHDIAECKQVITRWIDVAKASIQRIQRMLETCDFDQEEKEWFEKDIKRKEEYLGTLMGYLQEIDACTWRIQCLPLLMAFHPRLGQDSLLSQLSPDNLRWIAESLWD